MTRAWRRRLGVEQAVIESVELETDDRGQQLLCHQRPCGGRFTPKKSPATQLPHAQWVLEALLTGGLPPITTVGFG